MNRHPIKKSLWVMACLAQGSVPLFAEESSVAEFTAQEADEQGWRVVDDGVMGGLSKGRLEISDEGKLRFSGNLSLENNGGFSSLRTGKLMIDLGAAEGVLLRVKGDGRRYQMRFNTDARYRAMEVSFSAEFLTQKNKWIEVALPFNAFSGSFRGMRLKNEVFDPSKIQRMGVLLGDKKAGPFELEIDWIRTYTK